MGFNDHLHLEFCFKLYLLRINYLIHVPCPFDWLHFIFFMPIKCVVMEGKKLTFSTVKSCRGFDFLCNLTILGVCYFTTHSILYLRECDTSLFTCGLFIFYAQWFLFSSHVEHCDQSCVILILSYKSEKGLCCHTRLGHGATIYVFETV